MSEEEANEIGTRIMALIDEATTMGWLKETWEGQWGRINQLPQAWQELLGKTKDAQKQKIAEAEKNMK